MPEVANQYSYQSPIGAALQRLGQTIASGPSEAQRILQAEQAMKIKRENENSMALGDVFRQYGQQGFDRNTAMDLAIRAGMDPTHLAGFERYGAANTYGAKDPRTTNAFVGAGGAYANTAGGFDETQRQKQDQFDATLAENQRQFDQKPFTIGSPSGPVVSTQRDAVGQPAVEDIGKVKGDILRRGMNAPGGVSAMSPEEQVLVGASKDKTQTPHNYVFNGQNIITYDGVTDARNGQPLPQGGYLASPQGTASDVGLRPNVQGQLQQQDIEMQKFRSMLNHTRELAKASPSNFGVAGMVKGWAQDAGQIGQNLAEGLGYKGLNDAVEAAKARAVANGVDPNSLPGLFNFDPNLPGLHTAADLLVYQAASALAGQSGRSVSDRDVQQFRNIVGDPRDWTGNQTKFLAKLDQIDRILAANQSVIDQNLRRTAPSGAAPAAPGATPQPPTAPGAPQMPSDPLGIR